MKILVTGGAGFIGSHVVDAYIEAGHEVVVVDNLTTGRRENVHPEARFYEADIRDAQAIEEIFAREKPEVVNHHAAQVNVRHSVEDPIYDAQVNVLGSLNVLLAARRHGARKVIYSSTGGAVYGEPVYLPCDEDHPVNPICEYGATKHAVEHYLYMYRENYALDYTVLRYPNVYGPRQDPKGEAGVVAIFTRQMLLDEQVIINGSGEQERDFVYVTDCARANITALEQGSGEIYNLGTGRGTSVNEIFVALKALTGYCRDPVHGPPKVGETFRIYLDASRAQRELDWQPTISLEEGLRRTVEFFRARVANGA
ncbi:MAG: NAD-dependent epimerase/dehydratase family protein [Ardenticatenia bacterium]|nr:NAD-dependent epimerase/dehydratase family protein [Ardenticatenia bacterium]